MNKEDIKKQILEEVNSDDRSAPKPVNYQSPNDSYFSTELNSIVLKKFYRKIMPLPVIHKTNAPLIQYFDKNLVGNDYVVGDIHCQFNMLDRQLLDIGFDKNTDRLFAVGDLIDRKGQEGYRVLDYLSQNWFFSTLGNHEDMILTLLSLPKGYFDICWPMAMNNGAQWLTANDKNLAKLMYKLFNDERRNKKNDLTFKQLISDFPLLKKIYYEFSKLPYLIQINNVAIIHAEAPLFIDNFSDLVGKIESRHIATLESLLWGRSRVEMDINNEVIGINKIYCGHNILQEADDYSNHRMIDTGAYRSKSGKLHIEKINF